MVCGTHLRASNNIVPKEDIRGIRVERTERVRENERERLQNSYFCTETEKECKNGSYYIAIIDLSAYVLHPIQL